MAEKKRKTDNEEEFLALRRQRNWAILAAILILCVLFYAMTIIRVKIGG